MVTAWSVAAVGGAAAQTLGRAEGGGLLPTGGPRQPPCGCRAGGRGTRPRCGREGGHRYVRDGAGVAAGPAPVGPSH